MVLHKQLTIHRQRSMIIWLISGWLLFQMLLTPLQTANANSALQLSGRVDYLIIVNANLINALNPIIQYRRSQGLLVQTISPDYIIKNYEGYSHAEKIRHFLQSKYESWQLKFLLLVGDTQEIPYSVLFPSPYIREESDEAVGRTYSDWFYADLSSDFDSNNNYYPGEYLLDKEIDFSPEIHVGRIPFDSISDVSQVVNRILDFEKNPKSKTSLLASSILSYDDEEITPSQFTKVKTDGASLTESLIKDILLPSGNKSSRLYERSGVSPSHYLSEYPLNKVNYEKLLLNNPYDLVVWNGHGTEESLLTKIWKKDINSNKKVDKVELSLEPVLNTSSFTKTVRSKGLFITSSCSSLSPNTNNLGKQALKAGFSGFIGNTTINWYAEGWRSLANGGNQSIVYLTLRNLYLRNETLGEAYSKAIFESSKQYARFGSKDYQNYFSFTLYGDPAMRLSSVPFFDIDIIPVVETKSINLGESLEFAFKITAGRNGSIDIKASPINFRKDIFSCSFYADSLANGGTIRMKVLMAQNVYPTQYSVTIHFQTESKNIFRVVKFLILPWESSTHLYLSYPEIEVKKNTEFTIDVCIKKAKNINTVYAEIAFDNSILLTTTKSIMDGNFLSEDGILPKYDYNNVSPGIISLYGTRLNHAKGINGEGVLFSINFRAIRDGFTNVSIQKHLLMDPTTLSIPCKVYSAKVNVMNNGLYINRNITYGYTTSKLNLPVNGSTNGERLWIGNYTGEGLVEKANNEKFNADLPLKRWNTDLYCITQRGEDFIKIRLPVYCSSYITMALKIGEYSANVNGKEIPLEVPPVIVQGRSMVPIRFLSESFGVDVAWYPKTQQVLVQMKGKKVLLTIGKKEAVIEQNFNKKTVSLDVPPMIMQNRTLIPLRFVMEVFNATVDWNATHQLIEINYLK
ncbi:MAG: C25 family cysteine peptidase [Caldisericia bacterium]|nr:C25 family cysteine peptidase [Caldisericia bacterium]